MLALVQLLCHGDPADLGVQVSLQDRTEATVGRYLLHFIVGLISSAPGLAALNPLE